MKPESLLTVIMSQKKEEKKQRQEQKKLTRFPQELPSFFQRRLLHSHQHSMWPSIENYFGEYMIMPGK